MGGIGEALIISAAVSLSTAGLTYALTPAQQFEGARQKDLLTAKSSYGATIPWCWGTVRVAENKIWSSYKTEIKKKEKQGKGAKVETTTYSYYGNYAGMFCECPFRPVFDISRLWMNKKLVYSKIGDAETIAEGGKYAARYLSFYYGTRDQDIHHFLQNMDSIQAYSYGIPNKRSQRNAFLLSYGLDPATQLLSPAYRKRCYYVAQRLPLEDFYGALPSTEAEIIASQDCTVGQIFGDIFSLIYPDYSFDVSHISTPEFAVDGFFINSIQAAKNAIQNLQKTHFIDLIQTGNEFKFIPINSLRNVVNLDKRDLAAHQSGTQKPLDYEILDADPSTLPTKVIVNYIDKDLNYDTNQQLSTLIAKQAENDNTLTLSLSEVMTANKALTIANRSLMFAWILSRDYKFSLPQSYLNLEPTDLVRNIFDNQGYPVKLDQIRIGANLVLECKGKLHDTTPLTLNWELVEGNAKSVIANYGENIIVEQTITAISDALGAVFNSGTDYTISNGEVEILESGNIPEGTELIISTKGKPTQSDEDLGVIVAPDDTKLLVLDIPLLKDSEADYTIYLAAGGEENWNGAAIYSSVDNSRYVLSGIFETYSIYGTCVNNFDGNTVTVLVNQPELESISDNDLALGFNLALIGDRIVQFKTAIFISDKTYQLSDITPGLRGTEFTDLAQVGDRFVLLQGENAILKQIAGSALDIGQVRYFKPVSNGQTLDEVDPVTITIQGNAQKPYAPINLAATADGVGNINLTWQRRDRHAAQTINNPPLSETTEDYALQIFDDSTIVRTDTSKSQSYIYSKSDQLADFGVGSIPTDNITFSVAQISADVGNGTFAKNTVSISDLEPPPIIHNFSPASAQPETTITVSGENLAQLTSIKINDLDQDNLAVVDNQNVSFAIALATVSGKIELTTTGGTILSTNPLILEVIPPQKSNFPTPNPVTLPYTVQVGDKETEVIINSQTGILTIRDDGSAFEIGWGCYISLDGTGTVTIEKEDLAATGNKTDGIIGINTVTSNDTVKLWYRGDNTWKLD